MIRTAILLENGFQDEEHVYAYYRMQEEGWGVDVLTPSGKTVRGKFGVPARATRALESPWIDDYLALVIPGGFESPDRLRMMPVVQNRVRAHFEAGKLLAAICHGPWVLVSAGICRGLHMTGYESIRPDIENAGGIYSHAAVVTDGNVITAPHYRNNSDFMKAVVQHVNRTTWGPELCGAAAVNL